MLIHSGSCLRLKTKKDESIFLSPTERIINDVAREKITGKQFSLLPPLVDILNGVDHVFWGVPILYLIMRLM